jgi:broad specificity phosphatase PhoE
MPHRLILVRHGQSMGNIDEGLYGTTPDNAMPLTELGWNQAKACGVHLKNTICKHWKTEGIHFIVSPYCRTVETFHGIMSAWIDPAAEGPVTSAASRPEEDRLQDWYANLAAMGLVWHEDPRLREQDFGNFQDPNVIKQAKKDRHRFGAFYYRFPHGESASDVRCKFFVDSCAAVSSHPGSRTSSIIHIQVFDRVSTFLDSLWRSFDVNDCKNYVLVTHGISIRVILTRYFRYTIDQFHLMANPRNCEIVTLRHDGRGKLVLSGRYELLFEHEKENHPHRIARYKHHKKLRCLPVRERRKTTAKIAFDS